MSPRRPLWRPAIVLGILFVATAGAAVVTQRLKDDPALLRRVHVTPLISPNGDGWRDYATIRLIPGQTDRLAVTVLDADGHVVRRLARHRRARSGHFVRFRWHGGTGGGRPAPAGTYEVRVALRHRGRVVTLQQPIRLSRRPPHARGVSR
ncbi:MAG TPA: FlgD immunoglobulin-like domain containing protein [Baekduia sp.]|nr:FlgD immunoglobulin-like domain containing protein [Baekduia sp.]